MSPEMIGFCMIAAMLAGIFVGFPISFTLIFLGLVFGYWGFGDLVFYLMTLQFNASMMEQTLAAVPLFVFMGIMMEQANLMERLFDAVQKMLARVRGSLYLAVMFVATIFAAATGIVGASVTRSPWTKKVQMVPGGNHGLSCLYSASAVASSNAR